MKRFLPHITPAARIAIGLIALIFTLLLVADMALKLIPDESEMHRKIRASVSERLAMQFATLIQTQQWDALKPAADVALARDENILSLAIRQQNGTLVVRAGPHARLWRPPANGVSTLTHVRVPIDASGHHWGELEIRFAPVTPQNWRDWLGTPLVALTLIVVPVGFLAFYLYIRRTLQYLDPSAAIPDRVRVAFDALTEGVTVIDNAGRIMLHNRAFRQLHPGSDDIMLGKRLSDIPWLACANKEAIPPWEYVLTHQAQPNEQLFNIATLGGGPIRVNVKASPIKDGQYKLRGCMVTFYDVTELHLANETMRETMNALEISRVQIEQKNEDLLYLATRDPLTSCLNRRAFFDRAAPIFQKQLHEAQNIACIMTDIDFFKNVNDTYGHSVGDKVIAAVAHTLAAHLRENDLLCRYGGEEFCIVLPGSSEDRAMEIAERLRAHVEKVCGENIIPSETLQITSSFGVASLKSGACDLAELIELADFALYTSKQHGRNRVTLWQAKGLGEVSDTLGFEEDRMRTRA